MNILSSVRTALLGRFSGLTKDQLRRDLLAGLNVATMALPLSMAFAIASGVNPERGLFTAIIGGAIVSAIGGSRVQIGGPTGAFVIITFSVMSAYGLNGLLLCTMLAGAMLVLMGAARLGSIIRFMPYPVSRAFTKGIAVLILSTQIKFFFGLQADMPAAFVGKLQVLFANLGTIHWPTVALGVIAVSVIGLWPAKLSRFVPGSMVGLVLLTLVFTGVRTFCGGDGFGISTIGSQFPNFSGALPPLQMPGIELSHVGDLLQPAFTIAMLVAIQALMCAVVTDGVLDERHDSNQELIAQGVGNMVGPLFGCIPVTGAVARSVVNVRSGARTPVAGITHSLLLLVALVAAAPLLRYVPLAVLSGVLIVAAYRMVSWKQFLRLHRWPFSDSSVFLATFALTVLANLTLAVEVGVVLACLLMVKRVSETSQITAVDEASETEGSQHSLVGREVPKGVLIFRVFGAFFFGVVDKLDDELKRAKMEPEILILRMRKVLAIDATGLQALKDLHHKLRSKGKHLILSAPHTQPLAVMINAGFIEEIGEENVCPHIAAALARARVILKLPPAIERTDAPEKLATEKQELDAARREIAAALERAQKILGKSGKSGDDPATPRQK
jgi:SulP family sulfate permease